MTDFIGMFDEILDIEYDSKRDEYIFTGQKTVYFNQWSGALEGWVCKISPDGEVLWTRADTALYDPNHYVQHHLGGVALAPSGSIYTAGYISHSKPPGLNYGWIIKVTVDGCIDTICTTVSVEEQINHKDEQVRVYPNPFRDRVHFRIKHLRSQSILKVFGPDGKECYQTAIFEGENTFNIDFPTGMYFYAIIDDLGIFASGRFAVTPQ